MAPDVNRLQDEGYPIRKISTHQNPNLARQYNITGVPCSVLIVNGREVQRIVGQTDYHRLKRLMGDAGIERPGRGKRLFQSPDPPKGRIAAAPQSAAVAIAYASEYRERVSHLILYGAYARGRRRRGSPEAQKESELLVELIRQGWGQGNPAFRQVFTSLFMPDATHQQVA